MTQTSPQNLDKAFALLVDHAIVGARCPMTSGPDLHPTLAPVHIAALARQGRILVETSGHCWRQITILTGPHTGKKTAPNPDKNACIFRVTDAKGSRLTHAPTKQRAGARAQPSVPRLPAGKELSR